MGAFVIDADVHVCLVSEQLLPNLLPVLDNSLRPQIVALLVTPKMMATAERLELLLRETGVSVLKIPLRAYRIADIREAVLETIAQFPVNKPALNVTGGTKVMALGAYGVFRDLDLPVFYVDSENHLVLSLSPEYQTIQLADVLKIATCLKSYGYHIVSTEKAELQPENRLLYQALIDDMTRWEKTLGHLNYFAGRAEKNLWTIVDHQHWESQQFCDLTELFKQAGHLDCADSRLIFKSEESRRLVQGGWLEQHVYSLLEDLRRSKKVRDVATGIVVENRRGTKNEIDVACTHANKLHLVECKTAKLRGDGKKGDDVVYKLDNLRDLMGGTYGQALLVSYHQLREEDVKRCQDNDVGVVCGRQLQQLKRKLPLWLDGKPLI